MGRGNGTERASNGLLFGPRKPLPKRQTDTLAAYEIGIEMLFGKRKDLVFSAMGFNIHAFTDQKIGGEEEGWRLTQSASIKKDSTSFNLQHYQEVPNADGSAGDYIFRVVKRNNNKLSADEIMLFKKLSSYQGMPSNTFIEIDCDGPFNELRKDLSEGNWRLGNTDWVPLINKESKIIAEFYKSHYIETDYIPASLQEIASNDAHWELFQDAVSSITIQCPINALSAEN